MIQNPANNGIVNLFLEQASFQILMVFIFRRKSSNVCMQYLYSNTNCIIQHPMTSGVSRLNLDLLNHVGDGGVGRGGGGVREREIARQRDGRKEQYEGTRHSFREI